MMMTDATSPDGTRIDWPDFMWQGHPTPRSDRQRLEDILRAIDEVAEDLPTDRAVSDGDPPLQSYIYIREMIVGEAARCLSSDIKDHHPQIPWKEIESMRRLAIRNYFRADWDLVLNIARKRLPALKPRIEAILRSLPPNVP